MPWNPMRLHQRVGRLNRYGQERQVEVWILRNPESVESRIHDKLVEKIGRITRATGAATNEPEDLMELVLGMTPPGWFSELYTRAHDEPVEDLARWFDQEAGSFGGESVVEAVHRLLGHCSRFDFQEVSDQIPRVDLPDLKPFLVGALMLQRRQAMETEEGLAFRTPDAWREADRVLARTYERLTFDRRDRSKDAHRRLLGVGHRVMEQALGQARESAGCLATVPAGDLAAPLAVFRVADRVTAGHQAVRRTVVGARPDPATGGVELLQDWELLLHLNGLFSRRPALRAPSPPEDAGAHAETLRVLEQEVSARLEEFGPGYEHPCLELVCALMPSSS